jgi:hypothetical protein
MSRIWEQKKRSLEQVLREFAEKSPVLSVISTHDGGPEWRAVIMLDVQTLVKSPRGEVQRIGPVVAGIRYHERFTAEAPHPMEIVTILEPWRPFHPNIDSFSGAMCLGAPSAGIPLGLILHQTWHGLMFNMKAVNTRFGHVVNPFAAEYVRANAHLFPITRKGLFEEPDELKARHWHVRRGTSGGTSDDQ